MHRVEVRRTASRFRFSSDPTVAARQIVIATCLDCDWVGDWMTDWDGANGQAGEHEALTLERA